MFDIGWSELVLIGVVALIAIGPKELPGVLRMVGQWTGKMRRMASEFQSQFQEAMREAEMADLKKQVDDISQSAAKLSSGFDPVGTIRSEIKNAVETATTPPAAADAPLPITPPEPAAAETQAAPATPEPAAPADAAPPPASQPVSETRPEAGGGR